MQLAWMPVYTGMTTKRPYFSANGLRKPPG
jgi:hypothetical protein